ncbi:MAG: S9 family peptidase [Candidatus Eremiobacteraeota bacterium]|nr:S9 family peptidase [Candidatus Eremiobacteraeota bacterium]
MRSRFFVVGAMVAVALAVPAAARTLSFSDVRHIVSVSDPQISPDGSEVAYLESTADFVKDRTATDIMLVNVRTRRTRHLTWNRRGVTQPRWSPQGDRIAFLAPAPTPGDKGEDSQLFVMPMNGGDPRKVTSFPNGADDFSWSPDGTRFAVVSQNENPNKKAIAAHDDAFEVGNNDYLHTATAMPSHLWVVSAAGGTPRRLTDGAWSLQTVDPGGGSTPSWSPDGRTIAILRFPTPLIGDSLGSKIELVDVRTRAIRPLTRNAGLENDPLFSPKSDALAYTRNTNGDYANGNAVYVTRPDSPASVDVRRTTDRSMDAKIWSADGKALWLIGPDGARNGLWRATLGGAAVKIDLGNLEIGRQTSVSRNGALAFTASRNGHPSDIYVLASPSGTPAALTNENAFISKLTLGRVTDIAWKTDGYTEDGVLTYPPAYVRGKKYPLVLYIHGGPQSASLEGWSERRELFAAHGYLVFEPNYRGSTNLGDRYQHAISRDAGDGPGRDAMAGIAAVETLGIVDTSRIGVSGWSYGGYMTSWLIGHHHIWKAAVSGAALNDWFDDYDVAFYVNLDVPFFGGSPWNPRYTAMWRAQSPITYAPQITTPTLIMGDIGDNNVTITNSFKMYHALKDNNVPVSFIAYPVHGHFPSDPVRSEDVMRHWIGWLDRYLK